MVVVNDKIDGYIDESEDVGYIFDLIQKTTFNLQ